MGKAVALLFGHIYIGLVHSFEGSCISNQKRAFPHKVRAFQVQIRAFSHKIRAFQVQIRAFPHKNRAFQVQIRAFPHKNRAFLP